MNIGGIQGRPDRVRQATATNRQTAGSFARVLNETHRALRFSAHARTRIAGRNLAMTPDTVRKLESAVSGAAKKGAKDSLVLLRDMAFIVNVPNRTVVTAMEGETMKDHIVTNIDSTIIAA